MQNTHVINHTNKHPPFNQTQQTQHIYTDTNRNVNKKHIIQQKYTETYTQIQTKMASALLPMDPGLDHTISWLVMER